MKTFAQYLNEAMKAARYAKSSVAKSKKDNMTDKISQQALQDQAEKFMAGLTNDQRDILRRFSRKVLEPPKKIVLKAINNNMGPKALIDKLSQHLT